MLKRLSLITVFAALIAATSTLAPIAPSARAEDSKAQAKADEALDRLVFVNGNEVECEIIEETPTQITVLVHFGRGMPPTKATYDKSEIIEIQHDVGAQASIEAASIGRIVDDEDATEEIDPEAAKIYLVEFEGLFGSDISETPMRDVFEDADCLFDDLITERVAGKNIKVVDPAFRDKNIIVIEMDCASDPRQGFDGLFRAEDLGPIIEEQIQVKHRRVVFWVKTANDGAAFLPWLSPDVYFHPDGEMRFTQDLEDFETGDKMVDEKLISARFGHAEGFAIDGGYANLAVLIKPMARSKYWLYYRLVGGEPEFWNAHLDEERQKEGGWILLSDSGKGEYEDKNKVRAENDRLVLTSDIAMKLGFSKDEVRDEEGLAYALGVHRNYTVLEGRAERIFESWKESKEQAFDRINQSNGTLWQDFARIEVGGDYAERKRARGRQIRILQEIYSDVSRFAEVWDPSGQFRSQLSTQIATIKKSQQADKAAQRG